MSQVQQSSRKDFVVIGAGLGRTGTATLKLALEILLKKPCYHMTEVMKNGHGTFWNEVFRGERRDFDTALEGFGAAVDQPSAIFWEDMAKYYPDAKVLLSVRNPDKWYKSFQDTLGRMYDSNRPLGLRFLWSLPFKKINEVKEMTGHMRNFFRLDLSHDGATRRFIEWNEEVKAKCPADRLLVFEVSQGWEPLCKFLDLPIPDVPFPQVNDTKEFQGRLKKMNIVGCGMIVATALLAVGTAYTARKFVLPKLISATSSS